MKPRPCPPRQQRCADSTELLREYHGQRDHRLSTLPSTRPIRSWSLSQNGDTCRANSVGDAPSHSDLERATGRTFIAVRVFGAGLDLSEQDAMLRALVAADRPFAAKESV